MLRKGKFLLRFCGRKISNRFLIYVSFPSKLCQEIQKTKSRKKLFLHFGFAFVKAQNCFPFVLSII